MTAVQSLEKTGGPASNPWKPYPAYKPSGVEWFGDVPNTWGLKRFRFLALTRKGRLPGETYPAPLSENDLPYLSMEFLRGVTDSPTFVPYSSGLVCAGAGDILVLWDGSNAGEFLRAKRGAVSSTTALLQVRSIAEDFLFFACKAIEPQIKDQTVGMGIPHVAGDELKSFSIPLPTPAEQRAIADFLDRETGKIDRLVAKKRELIEKLKEERVALISRAVTRGLNPDAKLKPSGAEWLGDVPENWNVRKLGYGARLQGGYAFASDKFDTEGVPVVRMNNLRRGILDLSAAGCIEPKDCVSDFALEVGDLLWGMSGSVGPTGSLGNFARVRAEDLPAQLNQRVGRFRPQTNGLCNDYLVYVIQTSLFYDQILLKTTGTAQFNISAERVESVQVPFPSPDEQRAIAEFLDRETGKIDRLAAKVEEAIERLQEYRSALITAAVTGKIDVREMAT